jgi:3-deoxy-D-manno-octulosonic-acid transferase
MSGMRQTSLAGAGWFLAATLAEPGIRLLLARRLRAGKEIATRLDERRGIEREPRPKGRLLWIHAASVGEVNAVLPVIALMNGRHHGISILLTTATASSARLLAWRLPELGLQDLVRHRMMTLDVPRWIARFLDQWRPDAAVFVESELWPNTIGALRRRHIPAALINARMSDRSERGWRRLPVFAREILSSFETIWARSPEDAARLARLGRPVDAIGDLKDAADAPACDESERARLEALLGGRLRWLAASTHPGEDEVVAAAHERLSIRHPGLLTIVAPRHPERGEVAARILGAAPRRSRGEPPPAGTGAWVCDTIGEMGLLYRLAPCVFIGRSLHSGAAGGQNPLEAARLGCVLATGPHTANFNEAVARLRKAGALTIVADAEELADWVDRQLVDPRAARAAGEAARSASTNGSDLQQRTASMLASLTFGRTA